jgi:hypothetical protein
VARIRTIKPDFWGSPKTAKVSRDARLLFLGLLNEADDEGRLLGSARSIGGSLFPNDDDFSDDAIRGCLEALEQVGFIRRYVVEGVPYVLVIGFKEHQKISHPTESRLPEPPERASGAAPEKFQNGSGAAPEKFAPDLGTGNREQGTGNPLPPDRPRTELVVVPSPAAPAEDARALTCAFWENSNPKPAVKFIALLKLVERFLEAGWPGPAISRALVGTRAYTVDAIEFTLNAQRPEERQKPKSFDVLERRAAAHLAAEGQQ